MRFRISLERETSEILIFPVDYQYYISAWIYKVIGKADMAFSNFLHEQGYGNPARSFKLFTYSPLFFNNFILNKKESVFEIMGDQITFFVSFFLPDATEKFIIGLFNEQRIFIGNQKYGARLMVCHVERLIDIPLSQTMCYKALSPVVVSMVEPDKKYAQYLSPEHPQYTVLLHNNLQNKLQAAKHIENYPKIFDFKLQGAYKSKLTIVKPETPQQSKVRGYVYSFELTTSDAIHRMILSAGIGEKNSTGFGWVEALV
jgi:CRISPR-associated endoribonuclease Cas6